MNTHLSDTENVKLISPGRFFCGAINFKVGILEISIMVAVYLKPKRDCGTVYN